jgi:hypothetical protein
MHSHTIPQIYRLLKKELLQLLQSQKQNLQLCCHLYGLLSPLLLPLALLLPPLLLQLRAKQKQRRRIIHHQLRKHR